MEATPTNWTARRAVKIISFVLIIALCVVIVNRFYDIAMRTSDTGVRPEIVMVDLSNNQYFFAQHMNSALYNAYQIARYKSEDAINAGAYLEWVRSYSQPDITVNDLEKRETLEGVTLYQPFVGTLILQDASTGMTYAIFDGSLDSAEKRAELEKDAKRQQVDDFRAAMDYLNHESGLEYNIYDLYSNIDASSRNISYFKSQPVYYVKDMGSQPEYSNNSSKGNSLSYYPLSRDDGTVVYLAYTNAAVTAQNNVYDWARNLYIRDFALIAAALMALVALLVISLLGAGRQYAAVGKQLHFAAIDKPYLDISLVIVACWIVLIAVVASNIFRSVARFSNNTAINILFAAASVLIAAPSILWLLSLAKRVKAGRFWRHMLLYAAPSRFLRFVKSLWAGGRLTLKVGLIALLTFFIMIFTGLIGYGSYRIGSFPVVIASLIIALIAAFFLLRFARRINKLEEGARDASAGAYNVPIDVGSGALGNIAGSINSISASINTAVEQRMKSERLKTELITNVSHDIRTPLTSMITYTDLLKHEGLDCEKAPEYLDILIQKSQRLKMLTDELFEAAKAATGNIEVNMTELDIVSLINQVLGELDTAIKSSGLDLRVKLPERQTVIADGKLMWRVMENLLSNVFKYSLPGSRVYLDAEPEGDALIRVDLKNISAIALNVDPSELTERFKRGDDARADGGSGLGLSIVQSFVAAQGGRFEISIDGDLFKASVWLARGANRRATPPPSDEAR